MVPSGWILSALVIFLLFIFALRCKIFYFSSSSLKLMTMFPAHHFGATWWCYIDVLSPSIMCLLPFCQQPRKKNQGHNNFLYLRLLHPGSPTICSHYDNLKCQYMPPCPIFWHLCASSFSEKLQPSKVLNGVVIWVILLAGEQGSAV